MGDLNVLPVLSTTDLRDYTQLLFKDVEALETMISKGMFEEGVHRIGAEQELCLVDSHGFPAHLVEEALAKIKDDHFTTELAKFNLEINLDPLELKDDCFTILEQDLQRFFLKCQDACQELGCQPLLTGILPTLRSGDLGMDSMTVRQRYLALNQAILEMRKSPQKFHIQGIDELITSSDSVMFESCNTSYQIHYQIGAKDFASYYNWAQAIAGPVLAACANSPLFLGKRLWNETRIALFQQATDTRSYQEELRQTKPRVIFGDHWLNEQVTDFIKRDLSTYRPLVLADGIPNAQEELKRGKVPKLKAFALFNGTIYRWNRPCYGITQGKPHFRVENRYLPSGPSIVDEVANTMLWVGLMHGLPPPYYRIGDLMEFHAVKSNFLKAARQGLESEFSWMGKSFNARELMLKELIPIAKEGLKKAGIAIGDQEKYLSIIQERVTESRTGASWLVNSFNTLIHSNPSNTVLPTLTKGIMSRQQNNTPVHAWSEIKADEIADGPVLYRRVELIMSTDLYTVYEEDLVDLVPNIMKWNQVRHMLVENRQGDLVGLVTLGRLGKYYSEHNDPVPVMVKEVMVKNVITGTPDTPTLEAIKLMQENHIGCLPVLNQDKKLVGVVTEQDLLAVAASYLRVDENQSGV